MVACDLITKHQKKVGKKTAKKPRYNLLTVGKYHPFAHQTTVHGNLRYKVEKHRLVYEAWENDLELDEFILRTHSPNYRLWFNDPSEWHIHHIDHDPKNNDIRNLEKLRPEEHLRKHGDYKNFGHGKISWRKFESLEHVGKEMTYDIEAKAPFHSFVANNIVVHNSGKTATAINAMRYKCYRAKRLLRTLVFCPPIVVENWKREFKAHSTIKNVYPLTGPMKTRYKDFLENSEHRGGKPTGAVFITNYEALSHKLLFQAMLLWEPECIIFDESHKLKNPEAKRTKLATELADHARFKFLLSGTPVLKNALDLFSQFKAMDGGETFGTNYYGYRAQFFRDMNAGMPKNKYFPNWQPRPDSEKQLGLLISNKSMHIKKEECMDLPPLVRKEVYVELGSHQRKLYESMKRDLIAMIEDKACVAKQAMTKALRLQQITTGFVKAEDMDGNEEEIQIKDNPRAKALKDLLEEITTHSKVLVWACFKNNYETIRRVCEDLGLEYVEVHGKIRAKQRNEAIDKFQSDPAIKVFLGHPQSGGIGCNLTAASYSIFYSKNFSLEDDLQAEARNHRGGSEVHEKITRIDIIAQDTIDELISGKLKKKQEIGTRILGEIARKL